MTGAPNSAKFREGGSCKGSQDLTKGVGDCNYNAKKSNIPIYISTFLPDLSQGARNYEIRNPRLQPPVYFHEYITETCRYQLAVLLNEINSIVEPLDLLKSVVSNILNVTLLGLKRTVKSYLLQKYSYYCVIPNCYVCQRYLI